MSSALDCGVQAGQRRIRCQWIVADRAKSAQDTGKSGRAERGIALESVLDRNNTILQGRVSAVEGLSNLRISGGERGVERKDVGVERVELNGYISGHKVQ